MALRYLLPTAMIGVLRRLFAGAEPKLSLAGPADAARLAALHRQSFRIGWSAEEFESLLTDRSVTAHRAMAGQRLVGFIISRGADDEAEILSVAVAASTRRRGTARRNYASSSNGSRRERVRQRTRIPSRRC